MDTKDLRCFRLVYEERSINQAARHLFITPQGLSRIISRLEEELHTLLFERTSSGMIPTKTGDYFYEQSQKILYRLEDLKVTIQQIDKDGRPFRIGFACGVLNILPLQKLNQLSQEFPDLSIQWEELINKEVLEKVVNGSLDAGFVIGTIPQIDLFSVPVFSCHMIALVYPGHPFYERDSLSIEDLKEQPLITLNQKYDSYHNLIQRCSDFGFSPAIAISTMESPLIYRFCREKSGIGIDADIHQSDHLLGDLHAIPLRDAIPWKVSMICRENDSSSSVVASLIQLSQVSTIC